MATGDQPDILSRLKALQPPTWFTASPIPIVEGLLTGAASMLAGVYDQISFARLQMRISTASGAFLDLIALDFFGRRIMRKANQSDDSFRARILKELLRPRVTRSSLVAMLTDLTGRAPTVFEPALPADTGGYNLPCMGYALAGRYGSLQLPDQSFVTVLRPASSGIPTVGGYSAAPIPATTNLLLQSSQLATAPWTPTACTAANNGGTAPDGTALALVTEDTSTTNHQIGQTTAALSGAVGTPVTVSCYAREAPGSAKRIIDLRFPSQAAFPTRTAAQFDLGSGVWTFADPTVNSKNAAYLGGGVWRLSVTALVAVANQAMIGRAAIAPLGTLGVFSSPAYQGDGASGLLIGGFQMEALGAATPLVPTTTATASRAAASSLSALGGYNQASPIEYGRLSDIVGAVTDQDIYDAIESVKPAGTIVWTRIQNSPDPTPVLGPRLDLDFVLDTSTLS